MKAFRLFCAAAGIALAADVVRAAAPEYEQAPINYSTSPAKDPVAALDGALQKGGIELHRLGERGYLDALLRELKIPASSQTLVFSRTSFQRDRISPQRPRALYFNDDTYVGYVPGGDVIEIATTDPTLGTTFYTIDQTAKPKFARQTDSCLQCHGDSMTRGIPGLLVRSVFSDSAGHPILQAGTFLTTHESPLKARWGGWYVTGSSGAQQHMGNTRWQEQGSAEPKPLPPAQQAAADATALPADVDTSAYLSPHSDVVALMVLEHQVEAHNRITRAVHGTLRALRDEKIMADALGEPIKPGEHSPSTLGRIKSSCEPLVEYLLFAGEAPLTDKVSGTSDFAKEFAARGPRDAKGRSLRDLDLTKRLFRHPCSYLVYSSAIDGMPDAAKQYVYRRLWEVVSGKETGKTFAHVSAADRTAIAEILRETKPEIAAAWAKLEQAKP